MDMGPHRDTTKCFSRLELDTIRGFHKQKRLQIIKGNQREDIKALTWSVEEAGLPAAVGQLLLAVLRLADGSRQLLFFREEVKVNRKLVSTRSRPQSGELRVVVLDYHPGVLFWTSRHTSITDHSGLSRLKSLFLV